MLGCFLSSAVETSGRTERRCSKQASKSPGYGIKHHRTRVTASRALMHPSLCARRGHTLPQLGEQLRRRIGGFPAISPQRRTRCSCSCSGSAEGEGARRKERVGMWRRSPECLEARDDRPLGRPSTAHPGSASLVGGGGLHPSIHAVTRSSMSSEPYRGRYVRGPSSRACDERDGEDHMDPMALDQTGGMQPCQPPTTLELCHTACIGHEHASHSSDQ